MVLWKFFLVFLFEFGLLINQGFSAYNKHFEITANKIEVFHQPEIVVAKGDVVISREDLIIWAEEIRYEIETQYITLKKFKIFDISKNATIEGNEGFLDIRNEELWTDQIFLYLKKEQIRIKAFDFRKNALNEYFAKKAFITTCEWECEEKRDFPAWSLEVDNFILTPEGISEGSASKFRIGKVPLAYIPKTVYMPKMSLPITIPRKTGFLNPKFAQGSRLGVGVQFPFFWTLTDQIDFTISPLYFTKRGLLIDLENQFLFREDLKGILKFRYLKDIKKEGYAIKEEPKKNKWWIVGKIDYAVKPNLDIHLDLDSVSERGFLEEFDVGEGSYSNTKSIFLERFSRDIEDKSQEYRTSKFWLQYYKDSIYGRIESAYLNYHGTADKDTILQPFFNLNLTLLPVHIFGDLLSNLNIKYLYSYREEGYYGHKINTEVDITYPFKFLILSNKAQIRYNLNMYYLGEKDIFEKTNIFRNFFEFELSSYTILSKYYTFINENLKFLHVLKPYIIYFYRSRPTEINVPQFDYTDLISNKTQTLEYGLWQFFSLPHRKNFLIIRAYQQYDFIKAKHLALAIKPEEKPFSDIYFQAIFNYYPHFFARYDTTYNFYGLGFKKHSLNFGLRDVFLDWIDLTYQEDKAWDTQQIILDLRSFILDKFLVKFYISRNLVRNETTEMKIEGTYFHNCYMVGLGFSVTPEDTKFLFLFELKGLGGYSTFK